MRGKLEEREIIKKKGRKVRVGEDDDVIELIGEGEKKMSSKGEMDMMMVGNRRREKKKERWMKIMDDDGVEDVVRSKVEDSKRISVEKDENNVVEGEEGMRM